MSDRQDEIELAGVLAFTTLRAYLKGVELRSNAEAPQFTALEASHQAEIKKRAEFVLEQLELGEDISGTAHKLHRSWCESMRADGYTLGDADDDDAKTSPYLVALDQLPLTGQVRIYIFVTTVIGSLSQAGYPKS